MSGIAFFDLDRTLLRVNSGELWVRSEWKGGQISFLQAAQSAYWLLKYKLGFGAMEEAIERAVWSLRGQPERLLAERTRAFYASQIQDSLRPGGVRALAQHRARGDACVLLSTTSSYLAALVGQDLQLDGVLCTRLETDAQERFTGRLLGQACYGEGKAVAAKAYAAEDGVRLEDCTFYTDSWTDLPVLELVGSPRVVAPDPRLSREAARRGWPVLDWDTL